MFAVGVKWSYNATVVTVTIVAVMGVAMKFYNREDDLRALEDLYRQCETGYGKISVITGRRRVGKTVLARKFADDKKHLYLFTSKKAERLLCDEFKAAYEDFLGQKHIGEIHRFIELFELFLQYGASEPYVLIIDEFQEFSNVNPSVFSEIQKLWDEYKFKTKVHIVFIGSIYSLMIKIFQDAHEPLFGRADQILYVKPFQARVLKKILEDYTHYSSENLFFHYMITGGVPRYEEVLIESNSFSKDEILDQIFRKDSFFIYEGKHILIQEFGRDYSIYFSILELLSAGRTSRSEIESIIERSVGGYLERLENEYDLVEKVKPVGSKRDSRNQKYRIKDNFIKFWFRFIYRHMTMIEAERFGYVKELIKRDLSTYAGPILEKLFIEIKGYSDEYGRIGTYWEKGNKNEIDIVAVNDFDKIITVSEVKLNQDKINLAALHMKTANLQKKYSEYTIVPEGLALEDIDRLLREQE